MIFPRAAENWENFQEKYPEDYERPHWCACVPHVIDGTVHVEEDDLGKWQVWFGESASRIFDEHAPALGGPFQTAEEAKGAVDAWCEKWAPIVIGLESIYAVRRLVAVAEINQNVSDMRHSIGFCHEDGEVYEVLTADGAKDLIRVLQWAMTVETVRGR